MSLILRDTSLLPRLLPPSSGPAATVEQIDVSFGSNPRFFRDTFLLTTPDSAFVTVVAGTGLTFDDDGRPVGGAIESIALLEGPPDLSDRGTYLDARGAAPVRVGFGDPQPTGDAIQALIDAAATSGDLRPLVSAFAPFGTVRASAPSREIGSTYDMSARVDADALGDDVVIVASSGPGSDTLIGGSGADELRSEVGRARYNGQDVLIGGDGGDTYRVFLGDARDLVGPDGTPLPDSSVEIVEAPDGTGRDQLFWVGTAFDLRGTNVEDLVLRDLRSGQSSDTSPMEGTGSGGDNVITGTVRQRWESVGGEILANPQIIELRLSGLAGDDTIIGHGDGQTLSGGGGNDRIIARVERPSGERDAGRGTSIQVEGGAGDDAIIFNRLEQFNLVEGTESYDLDAGTGDDVVLIRSAGVIDIDGGAGFDELRIDIDGGSGFDELRLTTRGTEGLTLTDVESIRAVSPQSIEMTAVAGVERMRGDRGDDTLDTGAVEDLLLLGGGGDDTYVLRAEGTAIREAAGRGTDRVESFGLSYSLDAHVEDAALMGQASAARLVGNALDNVLTGDAGDNLLHGRGGADTLTGGDGADSFVINAQFTAPETIADFVPGEDRMKWVGLAGIDVASVARADALVLGTAATEAEHRLIFDAATGALSYDADGSGEAEARLIATFEGLASISAEDLGLI